MSLIIGRFSWLATALKWQSVLDSIKQKIHTLFRKKISQNSYLFGKPCLVNFPWKMLKFNFKAETSDEVFSFSVIGFRFIQNETRVRYLSHSSRSFNNFSKKEWISDWCHVHHLITNRRVIGRILFDWLNTAACEKEVIRWSFNRPIIFKVNK